MVSFDFGPPTLEPALPLEYLERLQLQNEIFADRVSFVGVAGERHRARIVTRQPHIRGEDATPDEIVFLMTAELGFRLLPERFSRQCLLVGTDPFDKSVPRRGANGNMGYKLTDNIGYTFLCVRLRLTTLQASF